MKTIINISMLICLFFSCRPIGYGSQYFTYPPGTKPHLGDYEYIGWVYHESSKDFTERNKKTIKVGIKDKNNVILLEREYTYVGASVGTKVIWNDKNNIEIIIYEEGNQFNENNYNKDLIENGPRQMFILNFVYDNINNCFIEKTLTFDALQN